MTNYAALIDAYEVDVHYLLNWSLLKLDGFYL